MEANLEARSSRRRVLAAAGGGIIGMVLGAMGRSSTVRAATGDAIVAGQANAADVETSLSISDASSVATGLRVAAASSRR